MPSDSGRPDPYRADNNGEGSPMEYNDFDGEVFTMARVKSLCHDADIQFDPYRAYVAYRCAECGAECEAVCTVNGCGIEFDPSLGHECQPTADARTISLTEDTDDNDA